MRINVETVTGSIICVEVPHNSTVRRVKDLIFNQEGIAQHEITLIFHDVILMDHQRLGEDCNVSDGATLRIIVQTRSGPLSAAPVQETFALENFVKLFSSNTRATASSYLEKFSQRTPRFILNERDKAGKYYGFVGGSGAETCCISGDNEGLDLTFTEARRVAAQQRATDNVRTMGRMRDVKKNMEKLSIDKLKSRRKHPESTAVSLADESSHILGTELGEADQPSTSSVGGRFRRTSAGTRTTVQQQRCVRQPVYLMRGLSAPEDTSAKESSAGETEQEDSSTLGIEHGSPGNTTGGIGRRWMHARTPNLSSSSDLESSCAALTSDPDLLYTADEEQAKGSRAGLFGYKMASRGDTLGDRHSADEVDVYESAPSGCEDDSFVVDADLPSHSDPSELSSGMIMCELLMSRRPRLKRKIRGDPGPTRPRLYLAPLSGPGIPRTHCSSTSQCSFHNYQSMRNYPGNNFEKYSVLPFNHAGKSHYSAARVATLPQFSDANVFPNRSYSGNSKMKNNDGGRTKNYSNTSPKSLTGSSFSGSSGAFVSTGEAAREPHCDLDLLQPRNKPKITRGLQGCPLALPETDEMSESDAKKNAEWSPSCESCQAESVSYSPGRHITPEPPPFIRPAAELYSTTHCGGPSRQPRSLAMLSRDCLLTSHSGSDEGGFGLEDTEEAGSGLDESFDRGVVGNDYSKLFRQRSDPHFSHRVKNETAETVHSLSNHSSLCRNVLMASNGPAMPVSSKSRGGPSGSTSRYAPKPAFKVRPRSKPRLSMKKTLSTGDSSSDDQHDVGHSQQPGAGDGFSSTGMQLSGSGDMLSIVKPKGPRKQIMYADGHVRKSSLGTQGRWSTRKAHGLVVPFSSSSGSVGGGSTTVRTHRPPQSSQSQQRCNTCGCKLNIASTFQCRCGKTLCSRHRIGETHGCSYDYKAEARKIGKEASRFIPERLPKESR